MRRLPAFAYLLAILAVVAGTVFTATPVAAATPVAVNDEYWVAANSTLAVVAPGVLANDTDAGGHALAVVNQTVPTHAAAGFTFSWDGSFHYTPVPGYTGDDTMTYQADDGFAQSNVATVTIHVVVPPVGAADSYAVAKNVPLSVTAVAGVLANDAHVGSLVATLDTGAQHGMLGFSADGSFAYDPDHDYVGTDGFDYTACIPGSPICTASTHVTLTVANEAPVANDDSYSTSGFGPLSVAAPGFLANDSDPNGDAMTVQLIGAPAGPIHGTLDLHPDGSFVYTPDAGFTGTEGFAYEACGAESACSGAWVSISVPLGVHRNAAASAPAGTIPTPVMGLYTDAAHGDVALGADGSFTYTPDHGYVGTDSFVPYVCTMPIPGFPPFCSAGAAVSIVVADDVPVAAADSIEVAEGGTATADAPGVLSNDTDPNGDTLTAELAGAPAHGTLNLAADGGYTYTPTACFHGTDSFTYRACDDLSACSAAATVTIDVVQPPVAGDDSYFDGADEELEVAAPGVLENDTIPAGATVEVVGLATTAHGTLTLAADGSFTYMPNAGYSGTDSFTYRVCRTDVTVEACSATVTVTISVAAGNRPPAFAAGVNGATWTVTAGSLPPRVVATDPDPGDGVVLDVIGGFLPVGLTLNPDGTWSGSTADDWGPFPLTIQGCDTRLACVTADVTLLFEAVVPTPSPSESAPPSASPSPSESPSAEPSESAEPSSSVGPSASASASARVTPPTTSASGRGDGSSGGSDGFVVVLLAGLLALSCWIATAARRGGARRTRR